MAADNVSWGEERIANELKLKLGIRVSPRTVGKYLREGGPVRTPDPTQRWLTFVHNHATAIVACDFFVVVTATFRTLYVFVILGVGSRRILNLNVIAHSTGGVNVATTPRGTAGRPSVSICGSRPGSYLLEGTGPGSDGLWSASGIDGAVSRLGRLPQMVAPGWRERKTEACCGREWLLL
jgi:hypothetical protein